MEENSAPSRRLRKKNNTHKALLHNAKKLFEKKGIGNVTIDEISEAADVSRSTFFTHFQSLDDLIEQIANEEISDLVSVWSDSDTEFSITALLNKLIEDTFPYPYLTGELLTRGILSKNMESSFAEIFKLTEERISTHESYENVLKNFSAQEAAALIMGGYFGLVFQKFIKNEPFDNDKDMKKTLNNFIAFLKK